MRKLTTLKILFFLILASPAMAMKGPPTNPDDSGSRLTAIRGRIVAMQDKAALDGDQALCIKLFDGDISTFSYRATLPEHTCYKEQIEAYVRNLKAQRKSTGIEAKMLFIEWHRNLLKACTTAIPLAERVGMVKSDEINGIFAGVISMLEAQTTSLEASYAKQPKLGFRTWEDLCTPHIEEHVRLMLLLYPEDEREA